MIWIALYLLGSGLVTFGCLRWGMSPWLALPLFLLVFLLLNLLFFLVCWLFCLGAPMDRPLEKQRPAARFCCREGAKVLCLYGGMRLRINGLDKLPEEGRFLFVCNHRSLFDPLLVMGWLGRYNIAFISKPSNLTIPVAGRLAYCAGFLPIDRENDRKALRSILTAADYLKRDLCSVGIYPEGTRSRSGRLGPFHAGSFKIAQRAGVPVVLASVRGTEKLMKRLFLRPTVCTLDILERIDGETVKAMSTQELSEHCRERILANLEKEGEQA